MAIHGRMLHLQLSLAIVLLAKTMLAAPVAPPDCKETCGGVSILYPFGLTDGCYLHVPGQESQQFKLACNATASPPAIQFMDSYNFPGNIPIIFPGESALQVMMTTGRNCYNGTVYESERDRVIDLFLPPFYTLSEKNKVYSVGCNKATKVVGYPLHVTNTHQSFEVVFSGVSLCQDEFGDRFPETCTGFGCSVNSILTGLQNVTVGVWTLGTALGTTEPWSISYPCSYGFVVDERNFTFHGNQSFDELNGNTQELPVLASWAIGNDNCEAAKKNNESAFACIGENSECVDRDPGYFCKCWDGYTGNPYLLNDCTDIDECSKNATLCSGPATCKNTLGSYICKCHTGFRNDDNDRNKCVKINETSAKNGKALQIALGVCLSFLVVLSMTFVIYHILKKRKFKQLCERYAEENGGSLISQELQNSKYEGCRAPRTFKLQELNNATNNFHDRNLIGEGSFGKVYKGTLPGEKNKGTKLPENKVVAVKKPKGEPPNMTEENRKAHAKQFINEMILLAGIKHKNVVTLLGCCLETKTPILVYELVSNGTLHEHIHRKNGRGPLSFGQRLRIAAETATSLAYLHHGAFTMPILHRDVKTSNILLDEYLTAKVSDFGASKLVPEDQTTQLATMVQGTLGYLDPQFIQTHQLTEKSDVYSFGVVLVELLTSKMATDSNMKLETEKNLANYFLTSVKENHLEEILDPEVIDKESFEVAKKVALLAQACLIYEGLDRPTMEEVETKLKAIVADQPGGGGKPKASHKETDHLFAPSPSNDFVVNVRSEEGEAIRSIDYDKSMQNQAVQMTRPGGR